MNIGNYSFSSRKKSWSIFIVFLFWLGFVLFLSRFPSQWALGETLAVYKKKIFILSSAIPRTNDHFAITLPFSVAILWGVFFGSALSYYLKMHPIFLLITLMGTKSGLFLYTIISQSSMKNILPLIFFCTLLVNSIVSKSAVHSIDCPWRATKRNILKPKRWLMGMAMGPWTFAMIYSLYGKHPIFFLIHNFSLLVVFGLIYPLLCEISQFLSNAYGYITLIIRKKSNILNQNNSDRIPNPVIFRSYFFEI
jgi:hypothetical protein